MVATMSLYSQMKHISIRGRKIARPSVVSCISEVGTFKTYQEINAKQR